MPNKLNFVYEWLTPEGALPNVPDFKDPEELMKGCSRAGLGDTTLNSGYINPIDCYIVFGNNYRLYPAESLPNEPFIYEINFSLNHYRKLKTETFDINKGFLNDCLLRPSVLGRIRNKQAYLYISTAFESEVEDELFERMHTYFQHKAIPLTQIIFVNNAANGAELYNEFCQARDITDKMNIEFIPFLRIRGSKHKQMMQDNPNKKYKPGVKSRDFLCWNRMYHRHRLTWYTELAKRNLVNNCYISMANPGDWDTHPLKGTYREYMCNIVLKSVPHNTENVFEHTEDDVTHAESLLPLYVDSVDLSKYPVENNPKDVEYYYNDSLIHLVTETHFFERKIHISEKTYKPITYHHPFIIIGAAGTLAELRRMGFKTFNDFWDESYDDCHDHATRMKMVMDLVESISKWSPKQKLKFSHDVADIVNYNYTHMLTMPNKELDCFLEKYGVSR